MNEYINKHTVDVAPVRHGRWENGNPICPVCGEDKFKDLDADIWSDWKPPILSQLWLTNTNRESVEPTMSYSLVEKSAHSII